MKYGILFLFSGILCGYLAIEPNGFRWFCLWSSVSLLMVGLSYLLTTPFLFGKRTRGSMSIGSQLLLLPYLLLLWISWNVSRLWSKEKAFHQILDNVTIGRRLLGHELPNDISIVVDLTCEFSEPESIRRNRDYRSFPILDADVPNPSELDAFIQKLLNCTGHVYIHCAQGHGRTGLVASVFLLEIGVVSDVESAILYLQKRRSRLRINQKQKQFLLEYWEQKQKDT